MTIIPGEIITQTGEIELNSGRDTILVTVANTGDRPIQVGSHYHFFETNSALDFDRQMARGYHLNIPAGTAIRFEPGQSRTVELVEVGGQRRIFGFRGEIMGDLKPKGLRHGNHYTDRIREHVWPYQGRSGTTRRYRTLD